ncbi:unnamed protein product [Phytophthora lilii]|uniref:Unnamed protein product n=1 Tax=Phytophthora lilii TaxID=2077276 RepID=A0A9W6TYG2_9STRA|nr:unnamed protein product [Phytophthora lilii]
MNGSSARRPPHDGTRLLLLLLLIAVAASQATAAACTNASTLVEGESDSTAIVYDASCNARSFQVVVSSTVERSLNLSNLDVVDVRSYPRVYQLRSHPRTQIMTWRTCTWKAGENRGDVATDRDFDAHRELADNFISDLSSFNFPRRLNYLDLSSNSITTLSSSTPWPESGELQTLLLHGNSLSSVGADTFTKLVALQSLCVVRTKAFRVTAVC